MPPCCLRHSVELLIAWRREARAIDGLQTPRAASQDTRGAGPVTIVNDKGDMWKGVVKGLRILRDRLTQQGVRVTTLWAADHLVRIVTGAPSRSVSEITPQLHVGGQHRRRGWDRLQARGVTAVVNLRAEWDDKAAEIAPQRYLYLPTIDDTPPSLADLRAGVEFITEELERGGAVYVHCGSGVGRAPTMAAAYLVSTGLSPGEAWAKIRAARPFITPKPGQVSQVRRFAEEPRPTPATDRASSLRRA